MLLNSTLGGKFKIYFLIHEEVKATSSRRNLL